MTNNLRRISVENESETWIKTGQSGLNDAMRGEQNVNDLSKNIISFLTKYLKGEVGVLYLSEADGEEPVLKLAGAYAFTRRKNMNKEFKKGESLIGQAALEKEPIVLSDIPDDEIPVSSGVIQKMPKSIVVQPFMHDGELAGVLEIGSLDRFSDNDLSLLKLVSENIAIAVNSARDRQKMRVLLAESQRQSDELLEQQQMLKEQSDALKATNEELETKTSDLEKQKEEVNSARTDIELKAKELELANKYKSEFLANMSHELRTPLNSLLILAKELSKNEKGNLKEDQVKDARIIYEGGVDLLNLINDILDLSKVEAGYLVVNAREVETNEVIKNIKNQFIPVSKQKNVRFTVNKGTTVKKHIIADQQRLEQILKNLLSNAFKFTGKGEVKLNIFVPDQSIKIRRKMYPAGKVLAFSVIDTGIGIEESKRAIIFEAFQQAEGGISRRYGGTGLGLTISREMASLLGGEIRLKSEVGKGSEFTLYLPQADEVAEDAVVSGKDPSENQIKPDIREQVTGSFHIQPVFLPDDRDQISGKDHSILIIEDDKRFAEILQKEVRDYGIKTIVTDQGKKGMELASRYLPDGIILDLRLPDINGLKVLDHLKFNLETRHIPVHVFSVEDEEMSTLQKGAIGFLSKPVTKKDIEQAIQKIENIHNAGLKEILIIEDNKNSQEAMVRLLQNKEIRVTTAATGKTALNKFRKQNFDCIILDLKLPDMSGFEVLMEMQKTEKGKNIPVIIYTGKELSKNEITEINKYTHSIIIKGVISPERLLDEVSLFLHSLNTNLSDEQRRIVTELHDPEQVMKGRQILIADDDMRNTYALSKKLTDVGMEVFLAENGQVALEQLDAHEGIEIVVMDIMMPVMDGLEAIRKIRQQEKYEKLPVISLTAKAMAEDKKQCMAAGANDYLTKPVDVDQLINLIRVWLYEKK
ncbi:MAG: response regulator [Mangrovibacterium sp.]